MARNIMIQGTASSVGKSIVNAAICRVLTQDGYRVAPYKSQNMALNSFVTDEGLEMGRAQVVQAEACRRKPSVLMNPVLLKPSGDSNAQVIIMGRVLENKNAAEYHAYKPELRKTVLEAYRKLEETCDIIVLEGAGSPAEINLRENDIVNMGMAEMVDAPVLLVADIDRGGVFASVVGTLYLLSEKEKKRVRGVIINKFRGDIEILKPGLKQLEDITGVPVIGVLPYTDIKLDDEDSVTDRFGRRGKNSEIDICVVKTPWISNFSDFNVFELFEDVNLRYAHRAEDIGEPDMLILPGSKNTIADMNYIVKEGISVVIRGLRDRGKTIAGICGGFQMLGSKIEDPYGIEGDAESTYGLGLIDMHTVMEKEKITVQVEGNVISENGILHGLKGLPVAGYEIHMGRSTGMDNDYSFIKTSHGRGGVASGNVLGTYIHGIFDNTSFTRGLLNNIRKMKGLPPLEYVRDFKEQKEEEFDRLAQIIRDNIDMKKIYGILEGDDALNG